MMRISQAQLETDENKTAAKADEKEASVEGQKDGVTFEVEDNENSKPTADATAAAAQISPIDWQAFE